MIQIFILFLAVTSYINAAAVKEESSVDIPTYSEPCKKNDPELNQCILNALKVFIPAVAKDGARHIGVPPLEPFYMAEQILTYKRADMESNVLLKNIYVHGATNVDIKKIRANFDNKEKIVIEADVHFPEVFTEGSYKMDGRIGNFILNGRGLYNMTVVNVNDTLRMEAKVVEIGGEEFLKATKISSQPDIGDVKMHASNLVNGNPELSKVANQFINQFWRLFYAETLPIGQEYFDKISRVLVNKILLSIPYKQLIAQE
ncbi:uncharacterized protein LOC142333506 [Lycorma delicatula]|uniref:uncharacterized protein LOC142333506 n=1 Tax=Lycorma delicatula TaxID=130591 RepID=UPI003F519DDD